LLTKIADLDKEAGISSISISWIAKSIHLRTKGFYAKAREATA